MNADMESLYKLIVLCHISLAKENPGQWQQKHENQLQRSVFTGEIKNDEPAAQRGMEGKYYIMSFRD